VAYCAAAACALGVGGLVGEPGGSVVGAGSMAQSLCTCVWCGVGVGTVLYISVWCLKGYVCVGVYTRGG
jgi:hypothetical protein